MEVMMAMKLSPAFGLFLFMATSPAQPVLTVEGLNGTSVVISADDLAKLPQQTIKTSDHGNRVSFEGVLLQGSAGEGGTSHRREVPQNSRVVLHACRGQGRVSSRVRWAELDSSSIDKLVYVVTKQDGKPLAEKDGPFRLVIPGEKRGARWVRQVTSLKIKLSN